MPPTPDTVSDPAKVIRIGRMAMELLDEIRAAPLDEAGRHRLLEIHDTSIRELTSTLSPDLASELDRLAAHAIADPSPSEAELRVAQAQLVGWIEGLLRDMEAAVIGGQIEAKLQRLRERGGGEEGSSTVAKEPEQRPGSYL